MVVSSFEVRGALWPPRTKRYGSRARSFLPEMGDCSGHSCWRIWY